MHAARYTKGRPILAAKYRDWKSGQLESAGGTPLENFPFLFTKVDHRRVEVRNIHTVEQLANLPDGAQADHHGRSSNFAQKAADWIAIHSGHRRRRGEAGAAGSPCPDGEADRQDVEREAEAVSSGRVVEPIPNSRRT